jgi:transposase
MAVGHAHERGAKWLGSDADDAHQHGTQAGRGGGDRPRQVEIITGRDGRRRWSHEEKAQITAESFAPGAVVAVVARRHGVSCGLLHYWRRCARESAADNEVAFVPVVAAEPASPLVAAGVEMSSIEIEIADARIRVSGRVDELALRRVLAAVRARD